MTQHETASGSGHAPDITMYLYVFGALLILTVVTVLVSYWHLPKIPAIALGLAIATVKASLVAAFFMHLKGERTLIYSLLALTIVFCAALYILPIADNSLNSDRITHTAISDEEPAPTH
jgi:cytochrome c oxidase subunit 4